MRHCSMAHPTHWLISTQALALGRGQHRRRVDGVDDAALFRFFVDDAIHIVVLQRRYRHDADWHDEAWECCPAQMPRE